MLYVSGVSLDVSTIINEYSENSIERELLNKMAASGEKYQYENINQLKFELNFRKEIVNSAVTLNNSGLSFATFKNSKCNPEYWTRTRNGGFLLKNGVKSGEAINDIFENGEKYATECATAMMIIYFKAMLNVFGIESFDKLIPKIYLMDWDITEPLLREVGAINKTADIFLGDRGYFNNPDFDPSTPEWQGENVIVLPDSKYYGHGIGIASADEIIKALNYRRKEHATKPAYFLDAAGRPDFKKLSDVYYNPSSRNAPLVWKPFPPPLVSI